MKGLSTARYQSVELIKSEADPWIVDPAKIKFLENSARSIEASKILLNSYSPRPEVNAGGSGVQWGWETLQGSDTPFVTIDQWKNRAALVAAIMPTELYLESELIGRGSSRHILAKNHQLKGVGYNRLADPSDYYHSWGGFPARDALRSLISDSIVSQRTPLGAVKTDALFVFKSSKLGFPLAIAYRQNDTFRLAQINSPLLNPAEIDHVRKFLFKRFGERSLIVIFETVMKHYVEAFMRGVCLRSVGSQNLTIDGRFLDTESIDFTQKQLPCVWVEISARSVEQPFPLSPERLSVRNQLRLHGSCFHDLKKICFLTAATFTRLEPKFSERVKPMAMLKALLSLQLKNDLPEWKFIFDLGLDSKLSKTDLKRLSILNFNSFNTSPTNAKDITLRYSSEKIDPRNYGLSLLQKTEWVLWPNNLNLAQAKENWNMLQRALINA